MIESGFSTVDESSINGEPLPQDKKPGDEVFSGTLNQNVLLRIRVTRSGSDTTLAQVVELVKQASERRSPVERTADGAIITATIPRELIVHAQTPQGARVSLMRKAFAEAAADEFTGTDEASLLERAGVEVAVVAGSARNFKITQPGDIELAEFYLGLAKG